MEAVFYIARNQQKTGPFSLAQLQAFVAAGRLQPTDMLLPNGTTQWIAAGSLRELFPLSTSIAIPAAVMVPPSQNGPPTYPCQDEVPKYPALERLASWYRFLAVVCGMAAVLGTIIGLGLVVMAIGAGPAAGIVSIGTGFVLAAGSVIWGALTVVSLFAVAESIELMMDVEATLREIRDRVQ